LHNKFLTVLDEKSKLNEQIQALKDQLEKKERTSGKLYSQQREGVQARASLFSGNAASFLGSGAYICQKVDMNTKLFSNKLFNKDHQRRPLKTLRAKDEEEQMFAFGESSPLKGLTVESLNTSPPNPQIRYQTE